MTDDLNGDENINGDGAMNTDDIPSFVAVLIGDADNACP